MSALVQDLVFGWRNARRRPATALLIVVTLALGIGVNVAMFSVAWQVLLAPLPYADADKLVKLEQREARNGQRDFGWSMPTFEDFDQLDAVFSDLVQYDQVPYSVLGAGEPYVAQSGVVSANYFAVLGLQPLHGHAFSESDEASDAEPVVLLSHAFWVGRMGARPDVVGAGLEVQGLTRRIIGVLADTTPYPHANDIWIPAANDPYRTYGANDMQTNRSNRWVSYVFGKLQDGVSLAHATREVDVLAQRLVDAYPDAYAEDYAVTLSSIRDEMVADSGTSLGLLLSLTILVLLIATANVASLNLARIADRNQELAIREAVGANPGRIVRQLLTENLLLAMGGGLLGLTIAWPCLNLLTAFAAAYTPLASEVSMDASLLTFTLVIAVLTGIGSGALSVFGRRDINSNLKAGGDEVTTSVAGAQRRGALLLVQLALSFVGLTITALVVLSLYRLNMQSLGYEPERILAVSAVLDVDFAEPAENLVAGFSAFSSRLLQEAAALAGVEAVGILGGSPLLQSSRISAQTVPFDVEALPSDPDAAFNAVFNMASAGYLEVMGIALQSGPPFSESDDGDAVPVAIVNASFVERFIPDGNALGQRVHIRGEPGWKTIVGVVDNVRSRELDRLEPPMVYYSLPQWPPQMINLYVKSFGNLEELGRAVTYIVHRIDPGQPVQSVKALSATKIDSLAPARLRASLITLFGVLALVLTLSGVIGVVSCSVRQRVREIGIHMAIGATPTDITGTFVVEVLKIYIGGLLLGLGVMLLAAASLDALLYQTSAMDVGVYLLSALVLTIAVLAAVYFPSSKAGALSPLNALHGQ